MDEQTIKFEMRLLVLESLMALLWAANHHVSGEDPGFAMAEQCAQLFATIRARKFADADPALSDHLSAELEAVLDMTMALRREYLDLLR